MMEERINLRVITPQAEKANEPADMVIMLTTTGAMGILPGHEARSVLLDYGVVRIFSDTEERRIAVYGGIAEIRDNMLTILTPGAEWPEDIDHARAEAERETIERRLQESRDDTDIQRDQALLRRSLVRIEVSANPLIAKPDWKEPN